MWRALLLMKHLCTRHGRSAPGVSDGQQPLYLDAQTGAELSALAVEVRKTCGAGAEAQRRAGQAADHMCEHTQRREEARSVAKLVARVAQWRCVLIRLPKLCKVKRD